MEKVGTRAKIIFSRLVPTFAQEIERKGSLHNRSYLTEKTLVSIKFIIVSLRNFS